MGRQDSNWDLPIRNCTTLRHLEKGRGEQLFVKHSEAVCLFYFWPGPLGNFLGCYVCLLKPPYPRFKLLDKSSKVIAFIWTPSVSFEHDKSAKAGWVLTCSRPREPVTWTWSWRAPWKDWLDWFDLFISSSSSLVLSWWLGRSSSQPVHCWRRHWIPCIIHDMLS